MRYCLPYARLGQTIGLLGGSFDPPHQGHVHITTEALKRFNLDRIWWLVSPGNPLKSRGPAKLSDRMQAARALMTHPKVTITDIEAQIGTRYTAATLLNLQFLYPGVRFVWLMGADNLAQFHHWDRWQWIMEHIPIGVIARPGDRISARTSKAATVYRHARINARASHLLPRSHAPAWCFANVPLTHVSSTSIRARGEWIVDKAG
ncbi:nicotinate-nucleotide adenylyltransferase [Parasulfitobacter algicola]|uniref:Probable nicotinate-nucleotide adenylyltransferase n=1 Tax=Parasulfitobacter algicola TaxID=2614809 RepID=A0ABX2IZT7_9RHOB|nr:nicotinate-nucleotide adenylyltransferase [Sulfitobacter algicola]NSX55913.1 nicotinate-nucleotide adenylyltransferase [Sulfitobacter algicola]